MYCTSGQCWSSVLAHTHTSSKKIGTFRSTYECSQDHHVSRQPRSQNLRFYWPVTCIGLKVESRNHTRTQCRLNTKNSIFYPIVFFDTNYLSPNVEILNDDFNIDY